MCSLPPNNLCRWRWTPFPHWSKHMIHSSYGKRTGLSCATSNGLTLQSTQTWNLISTTNVFILARARMHVHLFSKVVNLAFSLLCLKNKERSIRCPRTNVNEVHNHCWHPHCLLPPHKLAISIASMMSHPPLLHPRPLTEAVTLLHQYLTGWLPL